MQPVITVTDGLSREHTTDYCCCFLFFSLIFSSFPLGAFSSGLSILVVIDTNIMISHLEFVRSLKSEDIPGVDRLALIIPWVVLQELDNLKKGKMLQHVRDKAIPAVQFIYKCLKNQDSKLWGQSMQLASQKMCNTCAIHLCWVLHPCTSPSGNLRILSLMETSLCSLLVKMS